jgi:hypothetical protein
MGEGVGGERKGGEEVEENERRGEGEEEQEMRKETGGE